MLLALNLMNFVIKLYQILYYKRGVIMTFNEQQKRINKCYIGYYNDGVYVSRSFGRSKYYDKKFLQEQSNDNKSFPR